MGRSSKDKRDIYYRQAKEAGWRARSAFKLIHLNERFNLFKDVKKVVDLCAAPGSWSQVLAKQLKPLENPDVRIVSVDLQAMAPIPGVTILQGDITKQSTARAVIHEFAGEQADLVVCDGAPDVTGLHDIDEYIQGELLTCALNITTYLLKRGGTFVAKIFRGQNVAIVYDQMKLFFPRVTIAKPSSSRNSSIEAFIVCQKYTPPDGYTPTIWKSLRLPSGNFDFKGDEVNASIIPFLVCGDLTGYDADTNYPVGGPQFEDYVYKEPVQQPISPPYEESLNMRKTQTLQKPIMDAFNCDES
ncbi:Putative tRNA (cytidine(32)/guanosine(34)-2'-O)-methyltransferase 2 [Gryllus bimaculatus]|nr:Putative tRNA (cytidine(32)/guanosine(34)-2'-O)-methyltransferase 2 [Gryllus bimaculatus]